MGKKKPIDRKDRRKVAGELLDLTIFAQRQIVIKKFDVLVPTSDPSSGFAILEVNKNRTVRDDQTTYRYLRGKIFQLNMFFPQAYRKIGIAETDTASFYIFEKVSYYTFGNPNQSKSFDWDAEVYKAKYALERDLAAEYLRHRNKGVLGGRVD